MVDPSLAADATAAVANAGASGLAPWDGHTLSTLWSDEWHTMIYATLGLMGAYVTQVMSGTKHSWEARPLHTLLTEWCTALL